MANPATDDWKKVFEIVVATIGGIGALAAAIYASAQALKKIKDWLNSPTAENHAKILKRVSDLEIEHAKVHQKIDDMHREQIESATARQSKIGDRLEDLIKLVEEKRGR